MGRIKKCDVNIPEIWAKFETGAKLDDLSKEYGVTRSTLHRWIMDYEKPTEAKIQEISNARKVIRHFSDKCNKMNEMTDKLFEGNLNKNDTVKWGILIDKFFRVADLELQERKLELDQRKVELKELEANKHKQEESTQFIVVDDVSNITHEVELQGEVG